MAANIPDHYLWLGLGVFTFLAIQHVAQGLRHMRTLTEVHRPAPHPPSTHASRSSDAIKTASLLTLAHSHNIELSLSATTLLCERFYASHSARQLLLRDLGSANERVRRRARLAFRVLRDHGVFGGRGMAHVFPGLEPPDWEHVDVLPAVPRGGLREAVQQEEEERDARRRRREAVVIHEGEGRVGERDVWMRDRAGVVGLDVDADLERGELVVDGVVR